MVSAEHVGGTRGSGIVSSAAELMEYVRCVCVWLGSAWVKRGEWKRGLGLGFTNPVGTGEMLDVCLCFGCGGVGEEWVGGLDQGLKGWVVLCLCEL